MGASFTKLKLFSTKSSPLSIHFFHLCARRPVPVAQKSLLNVRVLHARRISARRRQEVLGVHPSGGPKRWKPKGSKSGLLGGWGRTVHPTDTIGSPVRRLVCGLALPCRRGHDPSFSLVEQFSFNVLTSLVSAHTALSWFDTSLQ
jgi:hypothetical protein